MIDFNGDDYICKKDLAIAIRRLSGLKQGEDAEMIAAIVQKVGPCFCLVSAASLFAASFYLVHFFLNFSERFPQKPSCRFTNCMDVCSVVQEAINNNNKRFTFSILLNITLLLRSSHLLLHRGFFRRDGFSMLVCFSVCFQQFAK